MRTAAERSEYFRVLPREFACQEIAGLSNSHDSKVITRSLTFVPVGAVFNSAPAEFNASYDE